MRQGMAIIESIWWFLYDSEVKKFASVANVTHFTIPSTHDVNLEIPVVLVQGVRGATKQDTTPLVVYFHGGGMALGSHDSILVGFN